MTFSFFKIVCLTPHLPGKGGTYHRCLISMDILGDYCSSPPLRGKFQLQIPQVDTEEWIVCM